MKTRRFLLLSILSFGIILSSSLCALNNQFSLGFAADYYANVDLTNRETLYDSLHTIINTGWVYCSYSSLTKKLEVTDYDTQGLDDPSKPNRTVDMYSNYSYFKPSDHGSASGEGTAWNKEQYNFNGPETLFQTIYENTKTWTNVNPITFEYSDYGHDYYKSICGDQYKKTVDDYECIIGQNGVGYENFKIDNNGIHFKSGYGKNYDIGNGNVYARTLTKEEAERLISYNHKITWLSGDEPFWTMTSDSDIYASMIFSAYYVNKNPEATTNYQLSFKHVEDEIGVRPVITINK